MIISKTPFRISLVGGGSDLSAYYARTPGAVLSLTIDKSVYVTVNRRFDSTIRVSYTKTEIVDTLDQLHHELVREAMRAVGVTAGVEITTIADVPAGTGLGSSSSLLVGLLDALHAFTGSFRSAEGLAREACAIEVNLLGKPIGKQDQYAAAYGGLNYIQFNSDESVFVEPIICRKETKQDLQRSFVMLYTGLRGDNAELLAIQREETLHNVRKQRILDQMVGLTRQMKAALEANDPRRIGELMHENWQLKRQIAPGISNATIDELYESGRRAGALGGKILGAGGGGFLLFCCAPEEQERFRAGMRPFGLRELAFNIEWQGSRIIYVGD